MRHTERLQRMDEQQTQVGIRINKLYNDAAKRYQSYVLLKHGREITKDTAIEELIALGAKNALPTEVFKMLELETPHK